MSVTLPTLKTGNSVPPSSRNSSLGKSPASRWRSVISGRTANPLAQATTALAYRPDGKIDFALGVVEDITERKRAEQEKLEMERRLLHAQKLESLGILAGGIAHDFNNILAGIMGYADLVKLRLPESEPAREDIDVIKKAVQRAADLTRQMLAYSGKGKFIVEPVSLSRVVEDSEKMLEMSVSKKAAIKYNLASDLPTTLADASQIHQVILNLVINASEALGEASGLIAISTDTVQCDEPADCRHRLGGTTSEKDSTFAWKLPTRVAAWIRRRWGRYSIPSSRRSSRAAGLGLAAVHGIVRGHKGAIRVFSEPGKGTTFQVLVPRQRRSRRLSRHDESLPARPGTAPGPCWLWTTKRSIRTLAGRMIEHAGFTVLTANDGEEAVRLYRQHRTRLSACCST